MPADIRVSNHGTIVLLHGQTPAGKAWLDANVQAEGWQLWSDAIAADPRYLADVVAGARNDGLEVV